jgi:hypothetical protein
LIGRIYVERQVDLQIARQRETLMRQQVTALVFEKPADEKLSRPAFRADVAQERSVTNQPSQRVENSGIEI